MTTTLGWHRGRFLLGGTSLDERQNGIPRGTLDCRSLEWEARKSVTDVKRRPEATANRLVKRLEKLGYQVVLQQQPVCLAA